MSANGWFGLLCLWMFFFFLYRDYRLDFFRQKLFGLRDELFDLGINQEIEFNHPAYGMLRSIVNGTIQYGHRFGLLSIVAHYLFMRKYEHKIKNFDTNWKAACSDLSDETRDKLLSIQHRMHIAIIGQIVFTSSLLIFILVLLMFSFLIKRFTNRMIDSFLQTGTMRRFMSIQDCSSSLIG